MSAPKRKVKAKVIVKDVRAGLSDAQLMAKYSLSPRQLRRILGQLVEGGFVHEMELYERSSLSETAVTRAFVEAQQAIKELEDEDTRPVPVMEEIDPKAEIEFTEVIQIDEQAFQEMLDKGHL